MARTRVPLQGKAVQIQGLETSAGLERVDDFEDRRPIPTDLNGVVGRVLGPAQGRARHLAVELWGQGMVVALLEENLEEYFPPAAEDGGYDLVLPSQDSDLLDFGLHLGQVLEAKGWALLQLPTRDDVCDAACREASAIRRFHGLKQEFLREYLGQGVRGKIHFLSSETSEDGEQAVLQHLDSSFTFLAQAVAMNSWHSMGFRCMGERMPGMLWLPYASRREELSFEAEPLNEDDVEEGLLEEHVKFLRRRKLACMTWLDADGGQITLSPAPGRPEPAVRLPIGRRKLLVFRTDRMTFAYEPHSRFVALKTWILEPEPKFEVVQLEGHPIARAEAMGIMDGPPYPEGDRVHVMSVMTRLPGSAYGPDQYWSMLALGTDGMATIPQLRWDTDVYCTKEGEAHQPGKCYTIHGGFCAHDEIYSFDNRFFKIPDDEAMLMAPSQRVVMEDGYTVLFRGGHTKASLHGRSVGIFLGDTGSDWQPFNVTEHLISRPGQAERRTAGISPMNITGASTSVVPCRLSHALNLIGPASSVDTACSSSLTATGVSMQWLRPRKLPEHLQHLNVGRLQEAVAGGICTQIGPGTYIAMCGLNMISAKGRCFTFDESGDGYARGEGCGLIYLKASEEESDMYDQLSCLLGCCVNQDGRSASMTAPNGPSQQACIAQSMREAGNQARDINLAECHGTGTALGDPIEVGALRNVMEPRDTTLAVTSSKSNIGHLEGSAGIAGFLKCVAMLMAGTCPPNAHLGQLNPHLAVNGFPCFFDTEAINACLNSALTGVSSFGFGGTNGRCDIWGAARFGPNSCGKLLHDEVDQLYTVCPVTLGKIDHITGEPLTKSKTSRGNKKRADILRDEFASYDVSRYAYSGGFRYRRHDLPETTEKDEFPQQSNVYIRGSWNGFAQLQEMDRDGDNLFTSIITLGEERYELFELCMDEKIELAFFPAAHRAGQKIAVEGPKENKEQRRWLIDGRDEEIPAGTVMQISFKFSLQERMEVCWKEVSDKRRVLALPQQHSYHVLGGFSRWQAQAMQCDSDNGQQEWSAKFRLGQRGREEFQIWKDADKHQAIYPAFPRASGSIEEARGPDEFGSQRFFQVQGRPEEEVQLFLSICDGKVMVKTRTATKSTREWESIRGWARHSYCLIHPSGGQPVPMMLHPQRPGVFTCLDTMGQDFDSVMGAYAHAFQVAVDGDPRWVFHPRGAGGGLSGEDIVERPAAESGSSSSAVPFIMYSPTPKRTFQVTLDLLTEDRRKTVTWAFAGAESDSRM
eukprot:TRINITY_DN5058_c0_g1_i1.p1 TRINITY_DN5058_c0_g1~~TRINITY_DN5058_c0_g1_i1.p1  ORF type:complete len:1261 (+),score=269.89 TRINITY_DN5058_c0_g1_i1:124-3906(+)